MTREPIEVTRQDRIYCLKASSDYHSELCEECRFYPNCDHMTQDDMTELTIKDLETLEQEPCKDAVSVTSVFEIMGNLLSIPYDFDRNITEKDVSESMDKIRLLPRATPQESRWIPVTERLPENAKHKGAFCPKCYVMTEYGVTEGWYNPDVKCWYALLWFMDVRFEEWNINIDKGDIPKLVKNVPVVAWMPLPQPYKAESEGQDAISN